MAWMPVMSLNLPFFAALDTLEQPLDSMK